MHSGEGEAISYPWMDYINEEDARHSQFFWPNFGGSCEVQAKTHWLKNKATTHK